MTNPSTIQTKRRRPRAGFRKLHAATRSTKKRKQRAATTANPEDFGEVPGVGVPLALVVILLLHVAAIAGIWIHDKWSSSEELAATKPALKEDVPPVRNPELDFHLVNTGETAASIAKDKGVTISALENANDGISEYQAGWKINIPNPPRPVPQEPAEVTPAPPVEPVATYTPTERPDIQTSNEVTIPGSVPGPLTEVGTPEAEAGRTNEAVLIRPVRRPVPRLHNPNSGAPKKYVVKAGDTFWAISRRNGISVKALMEANPGVSATTIAIGLELMIPPKQ
jgi:LysM repeat protein